jgi:2-isopropylmalate synthase
MMGYAVKSVSDRRHKELKAPEVYEVFKDRFLENHRIFDVVEAHYRQDDGIVAKVTVQTKGKTAVAEAHGNGRLDAVSNALKAYFGVSYLLSGYEQHALSEGSTSQAISYVGVEKDGKTYWGAGIHEDIITSSIKALVGALNNCFEDLM